MNNYCANVKNLGFLNSMKWTPFEIHDMEWNLGYHEDLEPGVTMKI